MTIHYHGLPLTPEVMLLDLAGAPLRKRHLGTAVIASGVVGGAVDSAVFLLIAFGSLAFIEGQTLGKVWMSLLGFVLIYGYRTALSRSGVSKI